jgi:FkbM family methyltransferase
MISYAQNGEDVVLDRAFEHSDTGFYVDVGASDPMVHSVTKHFYDLGWSGINIEPAEIAFQALGLDRPRDINLQCGVADEVGELTFHEFPPELIGCSTFSTELADDYSRRGWKPSSRTVRVTTLAAVWEEHVGEREVDFLKVDVEGNEREVVQGADFERFRPRVLVIEATIPGTPTPAHEEWEGRVLASGYRFTLFDGLNRFYVREEDADIAPRLAVPANVFDDYVPHQMVLCQDEAARLRAIAASFEQRLQARSGLEEALSIGREELARSQAALRDVRAELSATRAALMADLAAVTDGCDRPLRSS